MWEEKGPAWLVSSIGLLIDELTSGRPGLQSIVERAADMLFVDAWTVESLARAVGLSRTVFAKRFRALVSSTVMDYVASQRMPVAARMLASSGNALAQIANVVESDVLFNRAFRHWARMAPGQYRRRMTTSASM